MVCHVSYNIWMKHESFPNPKPVYKEPDSRGGAFDTVEMQRLRDQLEQAELAKNEPHDEHEQTQVQPKTEYEAINAAWDDAETSESAEKPVEHYTPEEAQAMIEALDVIQAESATETTVATAEVIPEPVSAVESEATFDEMAARENTGNALADIEIAFGNHTHEIVQTARVMAEQILHHLAKAEEIESQIEWEKSLQQKIDNLLQLRSDFVGPDGQKVNAEDSMDAVMPNAYLLQPGLADKRRAEILNESGVVTAESPHEIPEESDAVTIEGLDSLESDFSDASISAEVLDAVPDDTDNENNVYNESYSAVADARGAALMKNYKPSGVPLGYDPKAPRPADRKTVPKKKGFFARLFGG